MRRLIWPSAEALRPVLAQRSSWAEAAARIVSTAAHGWTMAGLRYCGQWCVRVAARYRVRYTPRCAGRKERHPNDDHAGKTVADAGRPSLRRRSGRLFPLVEAGAAVVAAFALARAVRIGQQPLVVFPGRRPVAPAGPGRRRRA